MNHGILLDLARVKRGRNTLRYSSWDKEGRNSDFWVVNPGDTRVLADIPGPAIITHVWSSWHANWREFLIRFTWDDAPFPSINVPFGDFFGLGHGIVNSYQSLLFSASTNRNNEFNQGCAYNCYVPMPFKKRAKVELVNQSSSLARVWFYIDVETIPQAEFDDDLGYFHAEFRREVPFGGWGHEIQVNSPESDIVNVGREAWDNNYVILETRGEGHYIGCNLSITNLQAERYPGSWWGEGDEMIWVDGYKWPPDIHGTGSEDYFNQGWGMQPNAFLRNGSSIYEHETGGYQTCYVHHVENPVRFTREIKVTIEHGHANHLANEVSSVAYWYSVKPTPVKEPPPVEKRRPIPKENGKWVISAEMRTTSRVVPLNDEMLVMKREWARRSLQPYEKTIGTLVVVPPDDVAVVGGDLSKDGATLFSLEVDMGGRSIPGLRVPIAEIIEDALGKRVHCEVFEDSFIGVPRVGDDGNVYFVLGGDVNRPLAGYLEGKEGSRLKIVFSRLLDDEAPRVKEGVEYRLLLTDKLSFRDSTIF